VDKSRKGNVQYFNVYPNPFWWYSVCVIIKFFYQTKSMTLHDLIRKNRLYTNTTSKMYLTNYKIVFLSIFSIFYWLTFSIWKKWFVRINDSPILSLKTTTNNKWVLICNAFNYSKCQICINLFSNRHFSKAIKGRISNYWNNRLTLPGPRGKRVISVQGGVCVYDPPPRWKSY